MRKLMCIFILFCATSTLAQCQQESDSGRVIIHITLDQALKGTDNQVYLEAIVGNEVYLLDSCLIEDGATKFTLNAPFPFKEVTYCKLIWLRFAELSIILELRSGEEVFVNVGQSGVEFPKVTGSPASEAYYKWRNIGWQQQQKLQAQIDSLRAMHLPNDEYQNATDSLDLAFKQIKIETYKALIPEQSIIESSLIYIENLENLGVPQTEIDPLIELILKKFPNDKYVKAYPNKPAPTPPPTQRSKDAMARIGQILSRDTDTKRTVPHKKFEIGDILDNIALKGLDADTISLADIEADYILVDFWAGWCVPCRKEIPYLKRALEKYKDNLVIAAISLDNTEQQWKQAIEKDEVQMFTHLYLGNRGDFLDSFGIRGIPANFLIDKAHKIVGINLRGDDLANKMAELTSNVTHR